MKSLLTDIYFMDSAAHIRRLLPETCQTTLDGAGRDPIRGSTYEAALDRKRLWRQLDAVRAFMRDGAYRTLAEIEAATGAPQASASARLRNLRHEGHVIERRRRSGGTFEYRMLPK